MLRPGRTRFLKWFFMTLIILIILVAVGLVAKVLSARKPARISGQPKNPDADKKPNDDKP